MKIDANLLRSKIEAIKPITSIPNIEITFIFGYGDSSVLNCILASVKCLKAIAENKNVTTDIKAFVEMPNNYKKLATYQKWLRHKDPIYETGYKYEEDEQRNLYSKISLCKNFCVENVINRGENAKFVDNWHAVLADCKIKNFQMNDSSVFALPSQLQIISNPLDFIRSSYIQVRPKKISTCKESPNGRLLVSTYAHLGDTRTVENFLTASLGI